MPRRESSMNKIISTPHLFVCCVKSAIIHAGTIAQYSRTLELGISAQCFEIKRIKIKKGPIHQKEKAQTHHFLPLFLAFHFTATTLRIYLTCEFRQSQARGGVGSVPGQQLNVHYTHSRFK